MKAASLVACIMLALIVSLPAKARNGDDDSRRRPRVEQGRGQEGRFLPPREFWRGRQDGPAAAQEEDPRAKRRRLTPEERQELRRDIRDAGRDIYGPNPRRRFGD